MTPFLAGIATALVIWVALVAWFTPPRPPVSPACAEARTLRAEVVEGERRAIGTAAWGAAYRHRLIMLSLLDGPSGLIATHCLASITASH